MHQVVTTGAHYLPVVITWEILTNGDIVQCHNKIILKGYETGKRLLVFYLHIIILNSSKQGVFGLPIKSSKLEYM